MCADTMLVRWPDRGDNIGKAVCAIGAFDGVHLGHRFLIESMCADAHQRGVASVIVTFDIDPDELFFDKSHVRKLLSNEDRFKHLSTLGADYLLVLPFTREFAANTTEEFLDNYLLNFMDLVCIHVGFDFKLGANSDGNVSWLSTWGDAHSCDCIGYDLFMLGGEPVTATRIRELIGHGRVADASRLLDYPFYITGTVVHGRGEGASRFDIPTANVCWDVPTHRCSKVSTRAMSTSMAGGTLRPSTLVFLQPSATVPTVCWSHIFWISRKPVR